MGSEVKKAAVADYANYYVLVSSSLSDTTESLVAVPDSLPVFLATNCGSRSVSKEVELSNGKKVAISSVFDRDARRANAPQDLKINGDVQKLVETDDELQTLVKKIDDAVGPADLSEVTEISSQRPGITLRQAIQAEFIKRFGYNPLFDANGVMDSSVFLTANKSACETETHLTGVIRKVIPLDDDEEPAEPVDLSAPIVYDATAEFDQQKQLVTYHIDFDVGVKKRKFKFCTVL